MKRYKVELKCWGWMLYTFVVDAVGEIPAYHEAKRVYLEHAERIGETDLRVELWSVAEVTS